MPRANLKESLFRLSKWVAFILGCGALVAGDAQANTSQIQPVGAVGPSNLRGLNTGQVLLRLEDERIFISHDGSKFDELSLADVPATNYLKELLRDANTAGGEITVPLGPIIVANGGSGTNGDKSKEAKKKKKSDKKETPANAPPANAPPATK